MEKKKKSADVTLPEALKEYEHACYHRKWGALNLLWAINVLFITLGLQNKISCYFNHNSTRREKSHWSILFPKKDLSHYSLEANCTAIFMTSFSLRACKQFLLYTMLISSLDIYNNRPNLSKLPRVINHHIVVSRDGLEKEVKMKTNLTDEIVLHAQGEGVLKLQIPFHPPSPPPIPHPSWRRLQWASLIHGKRLTVSDQEKGTWPSRKHNSPLNKNVCSLGPERRFISVEESR